MGSLLLFFPLFAHFSIFQNRLMSQFFRELCKLTIFKHSVHMENESLYRGDVLILSFFSIFLSFPTLRVSIENLCHSFLRNY